MDKKLHILFLSSWYPSKVSPTNGNFVQKHAEAVATSHNVTVLHLISNISSKKIETEKFNKNNVKTVIYYIPKTNNSFNKLYLFFKIYINEINTLSKIDLIHLSIIYPVGIIALYCKFIKKIPFILTEHWTGYLKSSKTKISIPKRLIHKFIARHASFICPVSEELKNSMLKFGIKGKYKVIGNVVDTHIFKPVNNEKNITFTITHVSSFHNNQKNIKGILNVIKKMAEKRNDFIFKIVGDGSISKLNIQIEKLKIPKAIIQTEGLKTSKEIAQLLQHSDLYVSFSNFETFGIVMMEALACGVKVISTNTGILNELNLNEFSSIINKGDEEALYQIINDQIMAPQNTDKKAMFHYVNKNYSIRSICNQYSSLYLKTLVYKQ